MAKADYWCCDLCDAKVIYGEPLDEGAECLCPSCAAASKESRVKRWTTKRGHRVVNGAHGCAIEVGDGKWHGDASQAGGTSYGPVLPDEATAVRWVTTGALP